MPVNGFFKIRKKIFILCLQKILRKAINSYKFWKVALVIQAVRNGCINLPREEFCSVDEQMIPFTGRMPTKQVIKSKPTFVGVKNWLICGKSGGVLDFELYQAAGTGISSEYKTMGLGAAVVLRLADSVTKNKNYKLYFDNYFTSIPLLRELKDKGILALGTLKNNRTYNCPLLSKKQMKMRFRGEIDSKISAEGNIYIRRCSSNTLE